MKKVIVIIIIILMLLAVLIGGGIFVYLKTDLLQSDKDQFFKYMSQLSEFFGDNNIEEYSKKLKNTPYTSEGTIKVNYSSDDDSTEKLESYVKNSSINLKSSSNLKEDYFDQTIQANYSDNESLNFEFIKDKDIIAIKENETISKFIGIENNKLKELAKKIGLEDEDIEKIPDKINLEELEKLQSDLEEEQLSIFTQEEIKTIKNKYLKIISESLTEDMFSKGETDQGRVYTFTITNQKIQEIRLNILRNLQEDEMIFNVVKRYLIENKIAEENEFNLEEYKDIFKGIIEEYNSEEEKTGNIKISIKLYIKNNELSRINLSIDIDQEDLEIKNISATIEKTRTNEEVGYNFNIDRDEKKLIELNLNYKGLNTNQITEIAKCNIEYNENMFYLFDFSEENNNKIEVIYNNQINLVNEIQKTELSDENIGLINDMDSSEAISNTFEKIALRFKQINMLKMVNAEIEENVNPFKYYSVATIPIISCESIKNCYDTSYYTIAPLTIIGASSMTMAVIHNSNSFLPNSILEGMSIISEQEAFNNYFKSYEGNGITAKEANKLVDIINKNNKNNSRKVSLYSINSKGKSKLTLDEENIKDINLPDNTYYYITMDKDKDGYIKKIYIQQGQKLKEIGSNDILERASKASYKSQIQNAEEIISIYITEQMVAYMNKQYIDSNSEGENTEENAISTGVDKAKESLDCTSDEGRSNGDYLDIKYDESKMQVVVSYNNYQVIGKISKDGIVSWGEIKEI